MLIFHMCKHGKTCKTVVDYISMFSLEVVGRGKWNEWGFRPPLCTCGLNWTRTISWGWWDEWADTALQTVPWRSEAKHATSRSRRAPTILNLYEWAGKKHFVSLKLGDQSGVRAHNLRLSKQAALTTAPGPPPLWVAVQQTRNIEPIAQPHTSIGSMFRDGWECIPVHHFTVCCLPVKQPYYTSLFDLTITVIRLAQFPPAGYIIDIQHLHTRNSKIHLYQGY